MAHIRSLWKQVFDLTLQHYRGRIHSKYNLKMLSQVFRATDDVSLYCKVMLDYLLEHWFQDHSPFFLSPEIFYSVIWERVKIMLTFPLSFPKSHNNIRIRHGRLLLITQSSILRTFLSNWFDLIKHYFFLYSFISQMPSMFVLTR